MNGGLKMVKVYTALRIKAMDIKIGDKLTIDGNHVYSFNMSDRDSSVHPEYIKLNLHNYSTSFHKKEIITIYRK